MAGPNPNPPPSTHSSNASSNPADLCRRCCDGNGPSSATKGDCNINVGGYIIPKAVGSPMPGKGERTEILTEEEIGSLLSMVMLMYPLYPPI